MFEFVCDHIIPGCTHTDRDDSKDKLLERVEIHMREHHDLDHNHDHDRIWEAVKRTGIAYFPPA
jgi:predicted small metal-binding protein